MTAPPVIAPPVIEPERRDRVGWYVLAAVGLPLLALINFTYFQKAFSSDTTAFNCERKLSKAVTPSSTSTTGGEARWKSVDSCVADLRGAVSEDGLAAMVAAAAKYERKGQVNQSDLRELAASKTQAHRAFAEVYSAAHLTPDRARELVGQMKGSATVYKLAKVHAYERAGIPGARTLFLDRDGAGLQTIVVGLLGLGAVVLGLGLWVAYGTCRGAGFLRPLGHPVGNPTLSEADLHAKRAAQMLGIYIACGLVLSLLVHALAPRLSFAASSAIPEVGMALAFAALTYSKIGGRLISLSRLGLTRQNLGVNVAWGVAGAVANLPVVATLGILSSAVFRSIPDVPHPIMRSLAGSPDPATILLLLLSASVLAPFIEEIWFRGTILPAFAGLTKSPVWGIVLTSLVFASLHPTGLPTWLPLASIGAMGALLTYQTRSLVPAMVMHALHNGSALAIALLLRTNG